jgi:hypothetical protein
MFPSDEAGYAIDDQYYIGDSGLLFKPVVKEGATETDVYLSDDEVSHPIPAFAEISHTMITLLLESIHAHLRPAE